MSEHVVEIARAQGHLDDLVDQVPKGLTLSSAGQVSPWPSSSHWARPFKRASLGARAVS